MANRHLDRQKLAIARHRARRRRCSWRSTPGAASSLRSAAARPDPAPPVHALPGHRASCSASVGEPVTLRLYVSRARPRRQPVPRLLRRPRARHAADLRRAPRTASSRSSTSTPSRSRRTRTAPSASASSRSSLDNNGSTGYFGIAGTNTHRRCRRRSRSCRRSARASSSTISPGWSTTWRTRRSRSWRCLGRCRSAAIRRTSTSPGPIYKELGPVLRRPPAGRRDRRRSTPTSSS